MVYEIVKEKYEEVLTYDLSSDKKFELVITLASTELFTSSEKKEKIDSQLNRGLINSQTYISELSKLQTDIEFNVFQTLKRILDEKRGV